MRDVHYPLDVITLDWEAFFDESFGIRDLSVPEYVASPHWEELSLAHLHVDGASPHVDPDVNTAVEVGEESVASYIKYLQGRYGQNLEGCTLLFQNAMFDAYILMARYGILPPFTLDTLCLARAEHARSKHGLGELCKRWGLKDKGKTEDFKGLSFRRRYKKARKGPPVVRPLIDDNQVEALIAYNANDVARTFELMTILLPRLARPDMELQVQHDTLELLTKPTLIFDTALGGDIVSRLSVRPQQLVEALGTTTDAVSGNISFDALLTAALPDDPQQYKKLMKAGWVYGLAKEDTQLAALKAHPAERVRQLVEARTAVKSTPLHISRVQSMGAMAKACGGLMPTPLNYAGGHTMRDSGAFGINLQNLPKRGESSELRGLLRAPDGHELVVCDLAAIEARVLAYFAGQQDLVASFTAGGDVYSEFGTTFYGKPVRKSTDSDPIPVAKLYDARRGFAKVVILGAGFGMGAGRFQEYAGCDAPTAEKAIKTYRDRYPAIPAFWRTMEKAFNYVARYRKPCALDRGISFHSTDDIDVVMVLPSGHKMHYHRVKQEKGNYDQLQSSVFNEVTKTHDHLWGGVLVENVVQSASRHIMMEAALRVNALGHRVVFRCHDELVCVAPKGEGKALLKIMEGEMSRTPTWAPGLGLGADGWVGPCYDKRRKV